MKENSLTSVSFSKGFFSDDLGLEEAAAAAEAEVELEEAAAAAEAEVELEEAAAAQDLPRTTPANQ